jgi:hypothetical protein
LAFNTYGDLYQGFKNSVMVELAAFAVLFVLHLGECGCRVAASKFMILNPSGFPIAGAAALSTERWYFDGSSIAGR